MTTLREAAQAALDALEHGAAVTAFEKHMAQNALRAALAAEPAVVHKLRQRIIHQRYELRRLNKAAQAYWAGVRTGMDHGHAVALRVKMIAAFGHPAVFAAEHTQPTTPKDKP